MSKTEFLISDEEFKKLQILIANGKTGLIGLKSGDMINLSSVESIGDAETEAHCGGDLMSKDLTRIFVQGEWKLFAGDKKNIEYRLKNKKISDIDKEIALENSHNQLN